MICLKYYNVIKCLAKPSINVRFSSKLVRKSHFELENNLIQQTLDQSHQPTTKEWNELRDKLLMMKRNRKTSFNVDTMILAKCSPNQLDVGKSYINCLKESGSEPDTSTLVKLLKLYYEASKIGTEITQNDQQDIIGICKIFFNKFPVFDQTLGEGVIYGLLLTVDWRKSLEILDSMKILSTPSSSTYSAIFRRALLEEDEHLAWNLLNNMVTECTILKNEVFTSYIGFCAKNSDTFNEKIVKMLGFIEENEILITTEVAKEFQRAFQKFSYECSIAAVTKQGRCQSCQMRLPTVNVSDDEFYNLSSHFLDKVLIGNNIFGKTTPHEFESFIKFIDKTKPYDCVIDGLNVAFSNSKSNPSMNSNMLASVVKHFVDRKKNILVIGRKHMEKWPKYQMNYISKNSNLFLTQNLSQDDPFFLYSTLKSGPKTDFVTRDLIRDHAFKLDKNLKQIFRRWQQQHQYMIQWIGENGKIVFAEPIKFDMNAHQVDGCWHIPFENDIHCTFHTKSFELRKNWLCVSKVI